MTYNNKAIEDVINSIDGQDDDFANRVNRLSEELDDGLALIDALPRKNRGVGLMLLKKQLGLTQGEFLKLVADAMQAKEEKPPKDFLQLRTVSYTHLTLPTTPYV